MGKAGRLCFCRAFCIAASASSCLRLASSIALAASRCAAATAARDSFFDLAAASAASFRILSISSDAAFCFFSFSLREFLHPFLLFLHDPVLLSAPVLSLFAQCQVSSGDSRQNALPLPAQSLLNFSPQYLLLPSQLLFPGGLSVRCGVVLPVLPAPAPSAFWSAPGIPSAGSGVHLKFQF